VRRLVEHAAAGDRRDVLTDEEVNRLITALLGAAGLCGTHGSPLASPYRQMLLLDEALRRVADAAHGVLFSDTT
jgi:hypothetical protein